MRITEQRWFNVGKRIVKNIENRKGRLLSIIWRSVESLLRKTPLPTTLWTLGSAQIIFCKHILCKFKATLLKTLRRKKFLPKLKISLNKIKTAINAAIFLVYWFSASSPNWPKRRYIVNLRVSVLRKRRGRKIKTIGCL